MNFQDIIDRVLGREREYSKIVKYQVSAEDVTKAFRFKGKVLSIKPNGSKYDIEVQE